MDSQKNSADAWCPATLYLEISKLTGVSCATFDFFEDGSKICFNGTFQVLIPTSIY